MESGTLFSQFIIRQEHMCLLMFAECNVFFTLESNLDVVIVAVESSYNRRKTLS